MRAKKIAIDTSFLFTKRIRTNILYYKIFANTVIRTCVSKCVVQLDDFNYIL